jgi:REP element-mobilizing transposase RayT
MPRSPRLELEGATFHIAARSNRGEPLFSDREDSLKFLSIFETICCDHDWDCFAYVLMPDAFQLTLRTNTASLAKGMQRLNGRYAGWVNRRRGTSGHLLGGRYRAVLVDAEAWVLPLVRLSALAPVRAGLAERAEQWLWSSWRYFADDVARSGVRDGARDSIRDLPPFLAREEVLALAGGTDLTAFVARGQAQDRHDVQALESLMRHNQVVGSRQFAKAAQDRLGLAEELTSTEPYPIAWFRAALKPSDRAMAAAWIKGGYRQKDIAAAFDTHVSTVSRAGAKYGAEFAV